jgi:metallo-beta-lactamase family protein
MRITLLGAAGGEVTGSAYLVEGPDSNVMVDCGLFQGAKKVENQNRIPTQARLQQLDAVVLTHAHLDHTGRLPLLTRLGYKGPIFATPATIDLTQLILRDSAYLQSEDARRQNLWRARAGKPTIQPLYVQKDVDAVQPLFKRMRYDHPTTVAKGITVRAIEAGHILGSASLEMTVDDGGSRKVVVFSGDLGPRGAPLHRDPTPFKHADVVFVESTYGDKDHPSLAETAIAAREAIKAAVEQRGRVLVPAFAVGRTQLLLYLLAGAFKRRTLKPFPVFLDSPMGIRATDIYRTHFELFDEEALGMRKSGDLAVNLRTVKVCQKAVESQALAKKPGPYLVLAGSGMCTGGRILHHLQQHLPKPTTLVMLVGYQGRGSIGRALADGATSVKITGQTVDVGAQVHMFGGLSGHAGQGDLLNWVGALAPSRPRIVLTHGEDGPRAAFARLIKERYGLKSEQPGYLETISV